MSGTDLLLLFGGFVFFVLAILNAAVLWRYLIRFWDAEWRLVDRFVANRPRNSRRAGLYNCALAPGRGIRRFHDDLAEVTARWFATGFIAFCGLILVMGAFR